MQTIVLSKPAYILSTSSLAGKKEGMGPLKRYFDKITESDTMGEKTFEKAEREMFFQTASACVRKANKKYADIDLMFSGDLTNQIVSSSYTAEEIKIPYVGIYSACATFAGTLGLASCLISGKVLNNVLCMSGSHFSTAERQYRYPLELGCTRPPQSQWTVTGAGASMISKNGRGPKITKATIGKVIDYGVVDVNNMGSAMAPATCDTLITHFKDLDIKPSEYNLIITGDLGTLGSRILKDLMWEKGYDIEKQHVDCGEMVYNIAEPEYQGGSGAGCSSLVFNSYFYEKLINKKYKKVLLVATGALLSSVSSQQGESIPGIAHAVAVES